MHGFLAVHIFYNFLFSKHIYIQGTYIRSFPRFSRKDKIFPNLSPDTGETHRSKVVLNSDSWAEAIKKYRVVSTSEQIRILRKDP